MLKFRQTPIISVALSTDPLFQFSNLQRPDFFFAHRIVSLLRLTTPTMPAVANEQFDLPLAKRQKRAPNVHLQSKTRAGSKIFAPFRVC